MRRSAGRDRGGVRALVVALAVAILAAPALTAAAGPRDPAGASFPGDLGAIAFINGENLYRMPPDGFRPTAIVELGAVVSPSVAWSAEGTQLAFAAVRDGRQDIFVANASGEDELRLTDDEAIDFGPAWFPSGTKIAFASGGDLWTLALDAEGRPKERQRLTTLTVDDGDPAVSPDGKRIAFTRTVSLNTDIYVMKANVPEGPTNRPIRLTRMPLPDAAPNWSPDGKRIAFTCPRQHIDIKSEICVMNADGSGRRYLTDNSAVDESPVWSPDGKRLAFVSEQRGDLDIFRMKADGTNVVRLAKILFDDRAPDWQPR